MRGCELLERVASDIGGEVRDAAALLGAPVRIQVVGRAGVGCTAVADLLRAAGTADVVESAPVDAPGSDDPALDGDVVVYVLAGALRRPDAAALQGAPRARTVALLNKADLQPSDAVARRIAAECAAETGVRTLPLVATGPQTPGRDGRADAVDAVADAVRMVLAGRARAVWRTLAEVAARGPDRDVLEGYLRSDEAVRLAVQAADALGATPADRRRRDLAHRRWTARTREGTR